MRSEKPGLCIVGHLLGRNPGYVTTQGQIIADLFIKDGYNVISVSSQINRLRRLTDVIWTLVLQRKSIDVLILEVYSGLSFFLTDAASTLAQFFRIPTSFVLRGGNLPEFTRRYPKWVKRVLKRADILVAPSTFLKKELEPYGFSIRVIPNVVAMDNYAPRVRNGVLPRLIWMRSFHPIYNPQMALDVLASLRLENMTATLVMAGADKGLEDEIKVSASRMGLQNSVRFPGFLDREAKIKEFSEADIYLNTNRIDNMPVSVVEACAMGLPVVATNVGGLPDLITDGENGLLVPEGDVQAMASAVKLLLADCDMAGRISVNARALAERSSWTNVKKAWEEVFAELLDRKCLQKNDIKTEALLKTSSG